MPRRLRSTWLCFLLPHSGRSPCGGFYVRSGFFFFFSSRRRHTRFKCDWSSDVCSSDLQKLEILKNDADPPAIARHIAAAERRDVGGLEKHRTLRRTLFHEKHFHQRRLADRKSVV